MTSLLHTATLALLRDKTADELRAIAGATGLKFAWLRVYAAGNIEEPGVSKIERLHKHLTGFRFPVEA